MSTGNEHPSVHSRASLGLAVVAAAAVATLATLTLTGTDDGDRRAQAQADEQDAADRRTIRIAGRATVDVRPDVATVSLGTAHNAASAKEALDVVSLKTAAVIEVLKDAGVEAADIQTSNLSVWPNYGEGEVITGYQASNSVTMRTTDLDGLGALLDSVSEEAGDQFRLDGISFSVDDPDAVLADVRADALADARAKAEQFVAGEDVAVGEIRTVAEQGAEPPILYEAELAPADASRGAVPIEAGSQELTVDVTVVFELT